MDPAADTIIRLENIYQRNVSGTSRFVFLSLSISLPGTCEKKKKNAFQSYARGVLLYICLRAIFFFFFYVLPYGQQQARRSRSNNNVSPIVTISRPRGDFIRGRAFRVFSKFSPGKAARGAVTYGSDEYLLRINTREHYAIRSVTSRVLHARAHTHIYIYLNN